MNYARYQRIVREQLNKYGKRVTFHLTAGPEVYDPVTGEMTQNFLEVEATAVMVSPSAAAMKDAAIQLNDAALLVDGLTLPQPPTELDTVQVDNAEWRIIRVARVVPAEPVIIYKIFIRRS